ncbi:MAG TPA: protein kinase [Thermoanaerobaculia bacterium]|nr:protein kinase [Thermoanaerobaculia bacterium]
MTKLTGQSSKIVESLDNKLHDEKLWEDVHAAYLRETTTREPHLSAEKTSIRKAMELFADGSSERYIVTGFLGVGGVGIVFRVWDRTLLTSRALKIARPMEGKEDLVAGLLSEEISRLQEVSHPNVISIFDAGHLDSPAGPLPFYTMTFLRGALDARKYFSASRTTQQLFKFMRGLLAGVEHLHSAGILHLDLKPTNVFVGDDGYAVVADLGGARTTLGDQEESLTITCTTGYAHPDLLALTARSTAGDDNRRRGTVKRKTLDAKFDRFSLGKTIFEMVHHFSEGSAGELSSYQRKYLLLLAARLLDGRTEPEERPLGLSEASLRRLKYSSTENVRIDLDKLLGHVNPLTSIPELSPMTDSVIQVTRERTTRLTPRLGRLLQEPLLRRLGSLSQLGLIRLVYPGACHTRLEHSLGAYSNAAEYIVALYNDSINPLFRQIMSEADLVAALLASLLHDLGQYQHAHDLEDVEPKVFKHETLTISLLKGQWYDFRPLTDSLRKLLEKDWGVTAEHLIAILEADDNALATDIRNRILHSIVSGPLDVDKLDYLLRDSDQCQTVFGGGLDRSRLLSTLTVAYQRQGAGDDQYFSLGIHEKGRAAAESIGFIRFQMFRSVYWHHAVRSAKAMLQRAAFEWIAPEEHDASQHGGLRDELYDFVLQRSKSDKTVAEGQSQLFGEGSESLGRAVGYAMRPQWTNLNDADLLMIRWLYERTTEVGKELLEAIVRRELYKRVFVVSAAQDRSLWDRIQREVTDQNELRRRSERLREAFKSRIERALEASGSGEDGRFFATGVGELTDRVRAGARVLGLQGTVLLDLPMQRESKTLRFYPEDLHRGQREDFEAPSLLAVSEIWKLLSTNLHETAGNIRVFVHPDIDVLRGARRSIPGARPLLNSETIEEELNKLFAS